MAEISETQTDREKIISDQRSEIEKLRKSVQYYEVVWEAQRKEVLNMMHTMMSVANRLAVSTCIEMTHRERNELARELVVLLVTTVQSEHFMPSDDIPF